MLSLVSVFAHKVLYQKRERSADWQSLSKSPAKLEKIRGLLNSQRIKYLFGHYDVDVLLQTDQIRVSNLHSNKIMHTCAVVNYASERPAWLKKTHDKIFSGGSLGQTIRDDRFEINKFDIYYGLCDLPAFAKEMMQTVEGIAAVHMYQFYVKNPQTSESCLYCTITEVHSPLYLTLGDLKQITPGGIQNYQIIKDTVKEQLETLDKLDSKISFLPIMTKGCC